MKRLIRTITAADGSRAELVQISRYTYSLNLAEIEADAKFFEQTGRLPVEKVRVF